MAKKNNKEVSLVSKDRIKGYEDDQFIHLADELTAIRGAMRMYISRGETDGALHLFKEIFNNALDECNNKKSPAKKVYVEFYESEGKFVVTDEGRGIPLDVLEDVVMKKHVGTKFLNSAERDKWQTGLNGVGLTVTAALTDYMSLTSYRGDHYKIIELVDGDLKSHKVTKLKKNKHGLSVVLVPSEKYLGEIRLTNDLVESFMRHMSYILRNDIKLVYTQEVDTKLITTTYECTGLEANVNFLSSSLEFPPVNISASTEDFDILLSFSYDKTIDEMLYDSYANWIITTEGGTHETAAVKAICEYFTKEARKLDPNSKYEVTFDDCRKGLVYAVNVGHVKPEFEGQHKSKFSNKDVATIGKKALYDQIYDYFSTNPSLARKIITYLRQISKIRREANKIKGVSTGTKKATTFLEDAIMKKFYNISDRNHKGYKEIYIAEGDSAISGLLSCRNPKYQAIFGVQGVIDNTFNVPLPKLLKKPTFDYLVKILGCGIGNDFDITKLRWNKIIIGSDSDVDGSNIMSLIICFFFLFMPEVITSGKLYRAMPPLYLLDKKSLKKHYHGNEWLYSKTEYYDLYNRIIAKNMDIALAYPESKKVTVLNKTEKKNWLDRNSEYDLELTNLGKKSTCDKTIIEIVCYYKVLYQNEPNGELLFKKAMKKNFPEMEYDIKNQYLSGPWNGERYSLIADRLFMKNAKRFIQIMTQNPSIYLHCRNVNDEKLDKMTIGQFYEEMYSKYNLKIEDRFKGLGEAKAPLLFVTTTNPKVRKLIRINLTDVEEARRVLELLHGKSNDMREERRKLLDEASISYNDIDN